MCNMGCKRENEKGECAFLDKECVLITAAENQDEIDDVISFIFSSNNVKDEVLDDEMKILNATEAYLHSSLESNDPKRSEKLLDDIMEQLSNLTTISKANKSNESEGIRNEFIDMIKDSPISNYENKLDSIIATNTLGFMTKLMVYKGYGYITIYKGSGYYSYHCTAEELLVRAYYRGLGVKC